MNYNHHVVEILLIVEFWLSGKLPDLQQGQNPALLLKNWHWESGSFLNDFNTRNVKNWPDKCLQIKIEISYTLSKPGLFIWNGQQKSGLLVKFPKTAYVSKPGWFSKLMKRPGLSKTGMVIEIGRFVKIWLPCKMNRSAQLSKPG